MQSIIFLIFKNDSSSLTSPFHDILVDATASQILLKTRTRMKIIFPLIPELSLFILEESVHFIHFDPSFLWCFSPNVLRSCECCYSFTNKGSSWLRSVRGMSFLCSFIWSPFPTSCFLGWWDEPGAIYSWTGHTYQQAFLIQGKRANGQARETPNCQSKED